MRKAILTSIISILMVIVLSITGYAKVSITTDKFTSETTIKSTSRSQTGWSFYAFSSTPDTICLRFLNMPSTWELLYSAKKGDPVYFIIDGGLPISFVIDYVEDKVDDVIGGVRENRWISVSRHDFLQFRRATSIEYKIGTKKGTCDANTLKRIAEFWKAYTTTYPFSTNAKDK